MFIKLETELGHVGEICWKMLIGITKFSGNLTVFKVSNGFFQTGQI
jgi:hypothetical protein